MNEKKNLSFINSSVKEKTYQRIVAIEPKNVAKTNSSEDCDNNVGAINKVELCLCTGILIG